jgi:uncharacterized membrane protein YbhN (UPF0104 family)
MLKPSLEYLKDLNKDENDRQSTAENKCTQIISSSGIFLTIIGLMISLLVTSRDLIELWFKIILVLLIICIVYFYVRSIILAFDGLDPKKYRYQRGLPETVNEFNKEEDFTKQVIRDYVGSITVNFELNNKKFDYVIKARKKFIYGIYTTGAMIILLIFYISFFYVKENDKIQKIDIVSDLQKKELIDIKQAIDSLNLRMKEINFEKNKPVVNLNSKKN